MPKFKPTPQQITKLLTRFTQQELASIFKVSTRTIRRWTKPPKPLQKQGRKPKLDPSAITLFLWWIYLYGYATQKTLVFCYNYLCDAGWTTKISQSTVCRFLKKHKLTYKKLTYQASEQLKEEVKEKIRQFMKKISFLPHDRILFLDECGFKLNLVPRYGYSFKGMRAISQRPGNRGENHTLIFLSQVADGKKIIHSKLIEGGINSKIFHEFISSLELPTNEKYYLIMDNLPVHRATDSCRDLGLSTIRELLASKNIEPIYLPPYSPELNPAERCFNIMRKDIESNQPRTKEALDSFIQKKVENFFQKEDFNDYWDSSIRECLMKNKDISPPIKLED